MEFLYFMFNLVAVILMGGFLFSLIEKVFNNDN